MSTRDIILEAVLKNQPASTPLPYLGEFKGDQTNLTQTYIDVFKTIGGAAYLVDDLVEVRKLLHENFDFTKRIVTTLPNLTDVAELLTTEDDPHSLEDVEVAIIKGHFAVAENGAVWLTDELMGQRIIPFICQHLAVIIRAEDIVPTLHEAYEIIGSGNYGFAGFIGGPSKTADIEQALVLGAHGPLSMTVYILNTIQ